MQFTISASTLVSVQYLFDWLVCSAWRCGYFYFRGWILDFFREIPAIRKKSPGHPPHIHDSKRHFPELLQALVKYENNSAASAEIRSGIDFVNKFRKQFYQGLSAAMQFEQRDMEYYTYGA
jgi:hypothetical protein